MQLTANHAKEFVKILGIPELKFCGIETSGEFKFAIKIADNESDRIVDPGVIAAIIHLNRAVAKGETPEEALKKQIEAIRAEMKI